MSDRIGEPHGRPVPVSDVSRENGRSAKKQALNDWASASAFTARSSKHLTANSRLLIIHQRQSEQCTARWLHPMDKYSLRRRSRFNRPASGDPPRQVRLRRNSPAAAYGRSSFTHWPPQVEIRVTLSLTGPEHAFHMATGCTTCC